MPPRIFIRAHCTPDFKKKVLQYAKAKHISEADVVRLAVQEMLDRAERGEPTSVDALNALASELLARGLQKVNPGASPSGAKASPGARGRKE